MGIWETARTSLAVGTAIYAQGDALGALTNLKVPPAGIIRSIVITDADDEASVTINVWLFDSAPAGIAANAAFALADADLEKVIGVRLIDSDFDGINGLAKFEECNIPYRVDGGLLYLQCELEGAATPTFAATTDVKIKLFIEY